MSEEVWKDIPGFEDCYSVSDLGNVMSKERQVRTHFGTRTVRSRILKQSHRKKWQTYKSISLSKAGKWKSYHVHRLVMLAFVGASDLQINHKDGNPANNRLDNLEYCTALENMRHKDNVLGKHNRGENCTTSILKESDVLEIFELLNVGSLTQKEIGDLYGVNHSTISKIKRGHIWSYLKLGEIHAKG